MVRAKKQVKKEKSSDDFNVNYYWSQNVVLPVLEKRHILRSLPAKGAWIEMAIWVTVPTSAAVAPCEGSVD